MSWFWALPSARALHCIFCSHTRKRMPLPSGLAFGFRFSEWHQSGSFFSAAAFSAIIIPTIITKAVKMITWITSDLFETGIDCDAGIDKNSKIVIKPRGAINTNGLALIEKSRSDSHRTPKIPAVMPTAQRMVSGFNNSAESIKNPNNKKNSALIKNAISAT